MSGVAMYGDLVTALTTNEAVPLRHRLESVKILPDQGQNDPDLYGHITAAAISRAEIVAPQRRRAVCLAVTSEAGEAAAAALRAPSFLCPDRVASRPSDDRPLYADPNSRTCFDGCDGKCRAVGVWMANDALHPTQSWGRAPN